ncbi:MAG: DNA cytosine methyltransferase, partial [Rhodococcus sp. (in: high G+C Gram-positive bacteria)]
MAASAVGRPIAIDLFSGAGGLSYGLGQAGFDVRLGLDNDKHALATYAENHDGAALLADVREMNGRDLMTEAGVSHVDLLAGGPSCQGFSTHGKRLADDPRNFLYKEFMRLVDDIRPSTVLIENVKGMLISGQGAFRREVEAGFASMGYTVTAQVLLAADYGAPQLRERVVFLASRIGEDLKLPLATFAKMPTERQLEAGIRPHRTVEDALSDLPRIGDDHRAEPARYRTKPKNDFQLEMRSEG